MHYPSGHTMGAMDPVLRSLFDAPEAERRIGPFVLVSALGRGGHAPVWLAHEVYGQRVLRTAAVKLFPWSERTQEDSRGGVVEEAQALCRVEHPNVVRFYSLTLDEKRGICALAMEYVEGTALDARLAERQTLPVLEALRIGVAIASALAAVHRVGLVHRDVKPGNVIESAGTYKLIDFGVAEVRPGAERARTSGTRVRAAAAFVERLRDTATEDGSLPDSRGFLGGTVGYVDPACLATGAPATAASDLYALGATLFECLTGKLPAAAAAPSGRGLSVDVLDGQRSAPSLAELAPEAPPGLVRVADALLAPRPEDRPRSAEWVAIALDQIRAELSGKRRDLPPEEAGPFRGLGRFEGDDRDVYFGRTAEIAAALEVLRGRGLLCLVGASGSGKSSFGRAGVLPALADGALGGWPTEWDVAVTAPGIDAHASLVAALEPFVPEVSRAEPEAIVRALVTRADETGRGFVLFVDQLEELATVTTLARRSFVVELLLRLGERALPGVRAVVAVRRDLLEALFAYEGLGPVLARGSLFLATLSQVAWGEVLDQALAAYGVRFEDEPLRKEVLAEIGATASAMPLVQFALTQLWRERDRDRAIIARASFRAIGGIAGALDRHADGTLAALEKALPGSEEAARKLLLSLTTAQGTRASRSLAELEARVGPKAAEVCAALERERLVVRDGDGVTLAHEALLVQWNRLAGWVADARDARLLAEELERDAQKWRVDPERAPEWRRLRRLEAEELVREGTIEPSDAARAFLAAAQRGERRSRVAMGTLAVLVVLGVAGGGLAYVRAIEAKNAENARLVEKLAAAPDEASLRELQNEVQSLRSAREQEPEALRPLPLPAPVPPPPRASAPPRVATTRAPAPIVATASPIAPTPPPSATTSPTDELPWK